MAGSPEAERSSGTGTCSPQAARPRCHALGPLLVVAALSSGGCSHHRLRPSTPREVAAGPVRVSLVSLASDEAMQDIEVTVQVENRTSATLHVNPKRMTLFVGDRPAPAERREPISLDGERSILDPVVVPVVAFVNAIKAAHYRETRDIASGYSRRYTLRFREVALRAHALDAAEDSSPANVPLHIGTAGAIAWHDDVPLLPVNVPGQEDRGFGTPSRIGMAAGLRLGVGAGFVPGAAGLERTTTAGLEMFIGPQWNGAGPMLVLALGDPLVVGFDLRVTAVNHDRILVALYGGWAYCVFVMEQVGPLTPSGHRARLGIELNWPIPSARPVFGRKASIGGVGVFAHGGPVFFGGAMGGQFVLGVNAGVF